MTLKTELQKKLKNAKRIALLGIGSTLRSDDAAGAMVAEQAAKKIRGEKKQPAFKVFFGATAPENLTGEIRTFKPSHVIMVDSANLGVKPGTVQLLDPAKIGGISFSTHALPLKMMADYLRESIKCKVLIVGIQPKSLEFGEKVSPEVRKAVKFVSSAIIEVIK
jgi:hydrogenase 3 maturation protease